jgi:bifunctional non-homologous end joining protein LigD
MLSRFVVHRHGTGRTHFDLRVIQDGRLRCWSLIREPILRDGQSRLAIERESYAPQAIEAKMFDEEAFGVGRVRSWDEGSVEISSASPRDLLLAFQGAKLSGPYRLRRMRWYPGNRWLFEKLRTTPDTPRNGSAG